MSDPVLDALMGAGGYPSAEFPTIGTTVGGRVVAPPKARQVREYDKANPGKGPLKFYPNSGDPIMGVLIDVQAFGPINKDDNGTRRIYAESQRQKEALKEALIAAGAGEIGIEVGGYVSMTWTGEEEGQGAVPAKTWSATYRTPAQEKALNALGGGQPPNAQQQYQQHYAQTQAQPVQPNPYAGAPDWAQPQPVQQYAPQPAAQTPPAQPAPQNVQAPVPVTGKPQITGIQAAAMANAGVDISVFEIVG